MVSDSSGLRVINSELLTMSVIHRDLSLSAFVFWMTRGGLHNVSSLLSDSNFIPMHLYELGALFSAAGTERRAFVMIYMEGLHRQLTSLVVLITSALKQN